MTSRQLAFDLPARPALGREAFFVAAPNRLAVGQIDRWPDWPERKLALEGPAGSGKSHLVHVWAARARARIVPAAALTALDLTGIAGDAAVAVEDGDGLLASDRPACDRRAAEERLFHLHNRLALGGGSLLLTGRRSPARWPAVLPDLQSRLAATAVARLDPPDDALLAVLIVKLFADRQLAVGPDLVHYLVPRIERSFAGAEAVVAELDRRALALRRPLTARLAAALLDAGKG